MIYLSKYYHCSSFPNHGDLQIDMKRRSHNLGTYKVRNEIETKRNEINETNESKTK